MSLVWVELSLFELTAELIFSVKSDVYFVVLEDQVIVKDAENHSILLLYIFCQIFYVLDSRKAFDLRLLFRGNKNCTSF